MVVSQLLVHAMFAVNICWPYVQLAGDMNSERYPPQFEVESYPVATNSNLALLVKLHLAHLIASPSHHHPALVLVLATKE